MHDSDPLQLTKKAKAVLYGILFALFLIFLRSFYLAHNLHEEKLAEARISGRKTIVNSPGRASIRDRFNVPLALNRVRYDVGILYSEIRAVPSIKWKMEGNQRVKTYPRREYIQKLALFLGDALSIESRRVEDEIHAKAAIYGAVPYIVKEGISEWEYHRLLGKKAEFPGLFLKRSSERVYPEGPLAGDLIGYMGAISREEYDRLVQEKEELRLFLEGIELGADLPFPDGISSIKEVKKRFSDLDDMAFRLNDSIGKTGIEARFEKELRGFRGKELFATDIHGKILQEYPGGKKSWPGKRILLSLSQALQKEAEELLILREGLKETRVKNAHGQTHLSDKEPWIKGGAIVAIDPNSGEILALATLPRIDPNDFTKGAAKKHKVSQALESESHVGELWDGIAPLTRERYDFLTKTIYSEEKFLSWDLFVDTLLSKKGEARETLAKITTVGGALRYLQEPKEKALPLVQDILGLLIHKESSSEKLLKAIDKENLLERFERMQAFSRIQTPLSPFISSQFSKTLFQRWREENGKSFIEKKRFEEKREKKNPKPYLDYLDQEERAQFAQFWQEHGNAILLHFLLDQPLFGIAEKVVQDRALFFKQRGLEEDLSSLKRFCEKLPQDLQIEYIGSLRPFSTLQNPIRTSSIRKKDKERGAIEQDLARAFYPPYGFGYGRSWAYRQSAPQGSIFKLITAYSAIMHPKKGMKQNLNPLTMVDRLFSDHKERFVGFDQAGKPIPQLYKGGRIPRSIEANLGTLDLLKAIEHSSNPYFSLLSMDVIETPDTLLQSAKEFSFGQKTGIDLPGEIPGKLPVDLNENPTGLFATAIGQHTLVVTPLQTSVMLSALANGGEVIKPQIVSIKAGESHNSISEIPKSALDPKRESLYAIGIDFPFFLSTLKTQIDPIFTFPKRECFRTLALPSEVRNQLLEGMRRVMVRQTTTNLPSLEKIYQKTPWLIEDLIEMKEYMVGKSSTAEVLVRLNADLPQENSLYTHVWFGGILFEEKTAPYQFHKPELVVIVFLRFGGYGKEALPIAARIAKKWREIKQSNQK